MKSIVAGHPRTRIEDASQGEPAARRRVILMTSVTSYSA